MSGSPRMPRGASFFPPLLSFHVAVYLVTAGYKFLIWCCFLRRSPRGRSDDRYELVSAGFASWDWNDAWLICSSWLLFRESNRVVDVVILPFLNDVFLFSHWSSSSSRLYSSLSFLCIARARGAKSLYKPSKKTSETQTHRITVHTG